MGRIAAISGPYCVIDFQADLLTDSNWDLDLKIDDTVWPYMMKSNGLGLLTAPAM